VIEITSSLADPRGRNIALQEEKSPAGNPKISLARPKKGKV